MLAAIYLKERLEAFLCTPSGKYISWLCIGTLVHMDRTKCFKDLCTAIDTVLTECIPEERRWLEEAKQTFEQCQDESIPAILEPIVIKELLGQLNWLQEHRTCQLTLQSGRPLLPGFLTSPTNDEQDTRRETIAEEVWQGAQAIKCIIINTPKREDEWNLVIRSKTSRDESSEDGMEESAGTVSTDGSTSVSEDETESELPFAKW